MEFLFQFNIYITCDNKSCIPELLTFCVSQSENCLDLSVTAYVDIHVLITNKNIPFKTIYMKHILFSFFNHHFLVQS